jgi:hypothetical protein
MRVTPLALFSSGGPIAVARLARRSARITHAHPLALDGAAVQAAATAVALETPPDEHIAPERLVGVLHEVVTTGEHHVALERVVGLCRGAAADTVVEMLGTGVAAVEAVPTAVLAFLQHQSSFEEAVRFAIGLGGDTDTIGSMTGALAGAHLGRRAIPATWLDRVEARSRLDDLAHRFARRRVEGPERPVRQPCGGVAPPRGAYTQPRTEESMPTPAHDDTPGPAGNGHGDRPDRDALSSTASPTAAVATQAAAVERVTVLASRRRRVEPTLRTIADELAAAGYHVTRADRALLEGDRDTRRAARGSLLIAGADPDLAAPLAAGLDAPLLQLDDIDDPAGLVERIADLRLEAETLLRLRPDRRPRRTLLAECVVAPADRSGALTVTIDGSAEPITTPVLRAATRDPLGIVGSGRCRYDGPGTMIGLCWRLDQPLADRMVPAGSVIVAQADGAGSQVVVRGDHDRFQGLADRVQLGPNQIFTRARLP